MKVTYEAEMHAAVYLLLPHLDVHNIGSSLFSGIVEMYLSWSKNTRRWASEGGPQPRQFAAGPLFTTKFDVPT